MMRARNGFIGVTGLLAAALLALAPGVAAQTLPAVPDASDLPAAPTVPAAPVKPLRALSTPVMPKGLAVPQEAVPEGTVPQTVIPQKVAPQTILPPQATIPPVAIPQATLPSAAVPQTVTPQATAPVTTTVPNTSTAPWPLAAPVAPKAAGVDKAPPKQPQEYIPRPPEGSKGILVWVPGYWSWDGQNYIWAKGSYQQPPTGTTTWVPGQWNKTFQQWFWTPGYWTRTVKASSHS